MSKSAKYFSILALVSLLAAFLVACGDNTATSAPAATTASGSATTAAGSATTAASSGGSFYVLNGATATNVPDALKTALASYESQYSGAKAQAYKISDQPAKVKEALANAFTKEGWQNLTTNVPDTAGGFVLGFMKNNKGAAAVAFPGSMAGLGASDLIYIVFIQQ